MRVVYLLLLMAALTGAAQAKEEHVSNSDPQKEILSLAEERANIVLKLQATRELQTSNGAKAKALVLEFARLGKELKEIEEQRKAQEAECHGGTYQTQAEADAANARCETLAAPLEKRVDDYNTAVDKAQAEQKSVEESEQSRIAEARPLVDRYDAIRKRVAALTKLIPVAERRDCVKSCSSDGHSPQSAAQCLQRCWDGADGRGESAAIDLGEMKDAPGPVREVPKNDVSRLGDRVANYVMDAIVHGDHDLEESKRILWRVLQAKPESIDYRDAYSYITGMEMGRFLANMPSSRFTPEEFHKMAPKVRMDDAIVFVTMVAGEMPSEEQLLGVEQWDRDVFEAFLEVHKKYPQNFTAVREELEARAKADPGNGVLRGALRQAQGAEVYQDDINRQKTGK